SNPAPRGGGSHPASPGMSTSDTIRRTYLQMLTLTQAEATARALSLPSVGARPFLLGIVGAPGAGKSTFAETLGVPILPMDGYHYANEHLERLGLRDRKGAPETFDVDGYASLLRRLRSGHDALAPRFDRSLDAAVAGALALNADSPLIVTEG